MNFQGPQSYGVAPTQQSTSGVAGFMQRVYGFMAAGLGVTAITALGVSSSPTALQIVFGTPGVFMALIIAELLAVMAFSFLAQRISAAGATALFFLYALLNGVTLSAIFMVYTLGSIGVTFFVCASTFGAMSVFGAVTKRDLSGLGHFAMMGLFGLIIASLVNMFLASPMLYWLTTYVGVIVFVALTAYDTQKIREMYLGGYAGDGHKAAVHGALVLYLDFVNLFLYLLRLFGRRRD